MRSRVLLSTFALLASSASSLAQITVPVYFNHVTVTLPAEAYESVARNPFLAGQFGALKTLSVVTDREKHTSLVLFGERTYIEFVAAEPSEPAGHFVFTLSTASTSELSGLRHQLKGKPMLIHRTRHFGDREVPWYDALSGDWLPHTPFALSVIAYDSEYLPTIYPDEPHGMKEVSRQQYLAPEYDGAKLFHDVKKIAISAHESEIRSMIGLLESLGYASIVSGDTRIARGPELDFVFMAAKGNQPESVELVLSLNRGHDGLVRESFADGSEFIVLSDLARWTFPAAVLTKK